MRTRDFHLLLIAPLLFCTATGLACAQGFSVAVSPSRIEAKTVAGQTYRDVVEINNVSRQLSKLSIKTADWRLDATGGPIFSDELAANSCRPWVAIERRELSITPGAKHRFRIEVEVPKETPATECRFALMIEGATQEVNASGLNLPVSGRIGVIVYLGIGDVSSKLALTGYGSQTVAGAKLPTLKISNGGTAHGRMEGFVEATDADGKTYTMTASNLQVLPGEQRELPLAFQVSGNEKQQPTPRYPLKLHGRLYDGHAPVDVSTTFSP